MKVFRQVTTTKRLRVAAVVSVLLFGAVGIAAWFVFAQVKHDTLLPGKPVVITHSTDTPSTAAIDKASYAWQGMAGDPKYVSLPSIHAEGFLQNVGVDQNKQIAVPTNVHLAGWYVDTVRPGQQGLSIIDGHIYVGGKVQGIFQNLSQLRQGDTFSVTFGDNTIKEFTVESVQTINNTDVPAVLFSQDPQITHQLNLITCGGTYDKGTKEFSQRVVVVARYDA